MRASIQFDVVGNTMESVITDARNKWAEFMEEPAIDLPDSTEFVIQKDVTGMHGKVLILTKVDR